MQIKEEDKAFSSIDFVGQCLVDEERTKAFQEAITASVKKGDTTLDLGTGSGILALSAAKAGAKEVIAIEYDPFVASIAQSLIRLNKLGAKVKLLVRDARTLSLPKKKFDVVTSELLTTGMVDEHQVDAINNLHRQGLVGKETRFIPMRQDTFVALTNAEYKWFGIQTPMILHLWKWHTWNKLKLKLLTRKELVASVDFRNINPDRCEARISCTATSSGTVNSILLTSVSVLAAKISVGDTEALNAPMLIPVKPQRVKKGEKITLKISYAYGEGYGNLKINFV